ncbi:MAG: hypothetical protein VB025_04540 [Sphaerochaeta sp.]|nr:hypothetical protein [Sphaerochaeta sp.]
MENLFLWSDSRDGGNRLGRHGGVLTAIIMVFEMTRDYAIMLSTVLSYFVSKSLYNETMYRRDTGDTSFFS